MEPTKRANLGGLNTHDQSLLESFTIALLSTSVLTQLSGIIVVSGAMSVTVPGEDTGFSSDGGVGYILDSSEAAMVPLEMMFDPLLPLWFSSPDFWLGIC